MKKKILSKLTYKLIIPFTLIVLIVFTILIPLIISLFTSSIEEKSNEHLNSLSSATIRLIDNERENLQRDLKLLIAIPLIEKALRDNDSALLTKFLLPVKESLNLDFIAAIDEKKNQVVMFHDKTILHEDMVNIDIVDKGLIGIHSSSISFINSRPYIVAVNASTTREEISIIIGGKSLEKVLTSKRNLYNELCIYNKEGMGIITTSSDWKNHKNIPPQILSSILKTEAPVNSKIMHEKGQSHLMLFTPLRVFGEIKAILGIHVPLTALLATKKKIVLSIVSLMIAGILLIIGTGYFILRNVSGRINNLLKGTREIASGKVGYRISDSSADEIGKLAVSFNEMSESLLKSHEWWKNTFDSMSDGVSIHDTNGKILKANNALCRMLGISSEELIGMPCHRIFHNKEDHLKNCPMQECRISGEPEFLESFEPFVNRWFSFSVSPVINADGKIDRVIHVARDITDHRKMEDALEKAAKEWRNTFDSISDFVSVFDTESKFVRVNRALADYLGVEPVDLIGKHCHEVFKTPDKPDSWCLIQKAEKIRETVTAERRYLNIDLDMLVTVSPITDQTGKIVGSVHIARDITRRKQAEENLIEESNISTSLLEIFETINSSLDEQQMIRNLMNIAPKYLKCDRIGVFLFDEDLRGFIPAGLYGVVSDRERILLSNTYRKGDFPAIDILSAGVPVIVNDTEVDSELSAEFKELFGVSSAALMPILTGEEVNGFIIGGYRDEKPVKTRDQALLKGLVDGIGIALHNIRLYKESTERLIELANKVETIKAMSQIDKEILSSIDKDAVLNTSIAMISRVIPCNRTSILLKEKKDYRVIAEWGIGSLKHEKFKLTENQSEMIEKNQSPVFTPDLTNEKDMSPYYQAQAEIGIRSSLMLPLISRSRTIGLLDIGAESPACFLPTHLSTAEDLVSQIAVALENANLYEDMQQLLIDTITSFASLIDAKSPWTKGHSERAATYSVAIAEEMGLGEDTVKIIELGGLLHDIGKIGTYDLILDKPDKLQPEEMKSIKQHTLKGASILKHIKQFRKIAPILKYHHERIDGQGYPEGLRGEDIPLPARIICVADAYDSMVSDRPYRKAQGQKEAIKELKRCSGTQFDTHVVNAFLKILSQDKIKTVS